MIDEFYNDEGTKISTRVWLIPEGKEDLDTRWYMMDRDESLRILEWVEEQRVEHDHIEE